MKLRWLIVGTLSFGATVACKSNPEGGSDVKKLTADINPEVRNHLSFQPSLGAACRNAHLFFVVASSEDTGKWSQWDIASGKQADDEALRKEMAEKFEAANVAAVKGLRSSFKANPGCSFNDQVQIVLAIVKDGPGAADTEITTQRFYHNPILGGLFSDSAKTKSGANFRDPRDALGWKEDAPLSWKFSQEGGLTRKTDTGAFEINLPASLTALAKSIGTNSPETIMKASKLEPKGAFKYSHITYIIKGHGGRLAINKNLLPDATLYEAQSEAAIRETDVEPVLLFDRHGEHGEISSSLYSAFWDKKTIQNSGQRPLLAGEVVPGNTAGENTPGNTSGENTPGNTSGENTPGNTSGENTPGNTAGDAVPGSTAGAGKSVLFSSKVVKATDASIRVQPEGIRSLGQVATYSDLSRFADGVHQISLPAGEGDLIPNLIILDSCYGDKKALDMIASSGNTKVALIANPNPMFFQFLDYGSMKLAEYLKLPEMAYSFGSGETLSTNDEAFRKKMNDGLLPYDSGVPNSEANKSLQFWAK